MNDLTSAANIQDLGVRKWIKAKPMALKIYFCAVILPTLIGSIYFGFIVSGIYESEAKYSVRSHAGSTSSGFLESVISLGGSDSSNEDISIIQAYITSRDILEELDKKLMLRKHFSSHEIDVFSRMEADASMEDFLDFYREMTEIGIDSSARIITLKTHAFTPQMSQNIAQEIISLSEVLVNQLSDRVVHDSLQFARNELDNAEELVRSANDNLTKFRSQSHSIDPGQETAAVLGIVTEMESQLASARTQLFELSGFMRTNTPQVKSLRGKVEALEFQVKEERKRLTSGEGSTIDYTKLIDGYAPLLLEQELTKLRYTSALTSLEVARIEAQSKQRYLISFVQPSLPDEATKPDRFNSVLVIFFGLSIFYAIGGLVWAAIKDHMRI